MKKAYMKMSRRHFLALIPVALIVPPLLAGCEQGRAVSIAVVLDSTGSTMYGRAQFVEELERLANAGYFPRNSQIALISSCSDPKLAWAGDITQGTKVKAALAEICSPCPCSPAAASRNTGSNPFSALEMAKAWLAKPGDKATRRVMLIFSDLQNDADQTRTPPRTFPDPAQFDWTALEGTEVFVYGLPFFRHSTFQKAWSKLKPSPVFHQPGEMLNAKDLKLRAGAF